MGGERRGPEDAARMQGEGDDVLVVSADLNDGAEVKAAVDKAIARFGRI